MSYQFSDRFEGYSLLHTPEGVRDIYGDECAHKLKIQNNLREVFRLYGFKDIQTPSFEFFDIFNQERGTIASREMYKFFDRDGNTLVLRPDITPSIARCAAKYYKEEAFPVRLCYMGNTYINTVSYQGKLKETTHLGAELINDDTSDADGEMIALTIECLLKAGLKEFQVEIGHAGFINGLLEEAVFDSGEAEQLKYMIESKNRFGVEDLVSKKSIPEEQKKLFIKLPELFGNIENLDYAEKRTNNARALQALNRLRKLYDILEGYGFQDYVTYDLGMLSKYDYYTGIIFKAYTYGNGEPIVKGGRYDNMVEQFGKKAPAIGLAIVVDQLMTSLSRQKIDTGKQETLTMILYTGENRKTALTLAGQFRNQGMCIELVRKSSKREIGDYQAYAGRFGAGGILYLKDTELIEIINISDGSLKQVKISDLVNEA